MIDLEAGLQTLQKRAQVAGYTIWAYIIISVPFMLLILPVLAGMDNYDNNHAFEGAWILSSLVQLVVLIASVVAIAMWIYRAHKNLAIVGVEGREFTPGWAVGWFFVPFANLIKPYQAMRELWNASHGYDDGYNSEAPSEVKIWWILYLAGSIINNIGNRIAMSATSNDTPTPALVLFLVAGGLLIAAAFGIKRIIVDVTAIQNSRLLALGGTFD